MEGDHELALETRTTIRTVTEHENCEGGKVLGIGVARGRR